MTKQRISLANPAGFVAHVLLHGDGVLLKNKQPDPDFPPAGKHMHLDQGAHERMGSVRNGSSVGLFRPEDESFNPYFNEFVTIYPGRYRIVDGGPLDFHERYGPEGAEDPRLVRHLVSQVRRAVQQLIDRNR